MPNPPSPAVINILDWKREVVSVRKSGVREAARENAGSRLPWLRTGSVDVETLAHWAYAAQMVDRFERAGLNAMERAASGFEPSSYSGCGVGQLMQIDHLGCRIDNGGVRISDAVHPVALAVAEAVAEVEHGRWVRLHALAGTRPTAWVEPEHKARAAVWVKPGKEAQVEYQGPGRKGGYCQVIIIWDQQRQAWGRADYATWWAGLAELAWTLTRRALGFVVTGPAAPAEPWLAATAGRAEPSSIALDPRQRRRASPPAKEGGAPTPRHGSSQAAGG